MASLARLRLSDEMTEKLTGQMNDILNYMDMLNQLDTSEVASTSHALDHTGAMREDKAMPSQEREKSLANAPPPTARASWCPRSSDPSAKPPKGLMPGGEIVKRGIAGHGTA